MDKVIRLVESCGGKYNVIKKALTLNHKSYHVLGEKRLLGVDKVVMTNIGLKNTNLPVHPGFPHARILAFNDCNKYLVSSLVDNEIGKKTAKLYPDLEILYTNTEDFGDIDILKSKQTWLQWIYIGNEKTWKNLPHIAKKFRLEDFKMNEGEAIYTVTNGDDTKNRYLKRMSQNQWNNYFRDEVETIVNV